MSDGNCYAFDWEPPPTRILGSDHTDLSLSLTMTITTRVVTRNILHFETPNNLHIIISDLLCFFTLKN